MTDQHQPTENPVMKRHRSSWATIGIFFSTCAGLLFMGAFSWGYFALAKVTMGLAMTVAEVKMQTTAAQTQLAALQKNIQDLQQAQQKSQSVSMQQQQILSNWQNAQQGNVDKWHVAEAHYLVSLAQNHLQFNHDGATAMVLLQQADKVLQNITDPKLFDLRKAISADLARLQAVPPLDTTAIYLSLSALDHHLQQLPLVSDALTSVPSENSLPAKANHLPWWRASLAYTQHALSNIVIVRKTDPNTLPIVLPEEKAYLYQNLHAQIENAQWGLLHRNAEIYQTSLARAATEIAHYFVLNAQATQSALQAIAELQKINIQPPAVDLTNTLQLFNGYSISGNDLGT